MTQRYFYHSFPRHQGGPADSWPTDPSAIDTGKAILDLIAQFGLLLTPEIVTVDPELLADGSYSSGFPIYQKRVCFTGIRPDELLEHAKCFGPYALEFDVVKLRTNGALPVNYIAKQVGSGAQLGGAGISMLHRMYNLCVLVSTLNSCKSNIANFITTLGIPTNQQVESTLSTLLSAFEQKSHDFGQLTLFTNALACYYYPAEPSPHSLLEYFQEREWRITNEFSNIMSGQRLCEDLDPTHKSQLVMFNPGYFSASITMLTSTPKNVVEVCKVIKQFDGDDILTASNRIIVPDSELSVVKAKYPAHASKIVGLSTI